MNNELNIYKQEKVACTERHISSTKKYKILKKQQTVKSKTIFNLLKRLDDDILDAQWLQIVFGLYGRKFTFSLIKFLNKEKINDLHNSNIGYDSSNKPKFIDFSGYRNFF